MDRFWGQRTLAALMLFLMVSVPVRAELVREAALYRLPPVTHEYPTTAFPSPPLPASPQTNYIPPGFPSVQELLKEIAADTLSQLEARFMGIVQKFGTQGVLLLQQTIEELLKKNLSQKEMALLTTVLELATNEQIIAAAQNVQRSGGRQFGPWSHLGQAIVIELGKRKWGKMAPELKALKILANQTMEILTLTPKARQEFRSSQAKFKDALLIMGEGRLDGQGILRLAEASGSFIHSALKEVGRDIKMAVQPPRLEKTIDAALLLANSIANTDPTTKVWLRQVLARELEIDRIRTNSDGSVNWHDTIGEIAAIQPDDARAVGKVLQSQGLITADDVKKMETTVQHMQDARDTVAQLGRLARMGEPRTPKEFQDQMEEIKKLAAHMNRTGQLGDDLTVATLQVASAMSAASHAQEAGRMIGDNLQNPITQRNLGYLGERLMTWR